MASQKTLFRSACAAGLLLCTALAATAQDLTAPTGYTQPTVAWKPVGGSTNWFDAANWVTGASSVSPSQGFAWSDVAGWTAPAGVPTSASVVGLPVRGGSPVINLLYSGTGDTTASVGEIQYVDAYTLNLQGSSAGRLTLDLTGRGFARYWQNSTALPNSVASGRPLTVNIGDDSTLRVSGTVARYVDNWSDRFVSFNLTASTSVLDYSATTQNRDLGSLSGVAGSSVITRPGAAMRVGYLNFTTTFAGVISGTGSLQKEGEGNLTLTGANTYTGTTAVNNGALLVNGSIGTGLVTVGNAYFGGSGTVGGSVNSNSTGFISPGAQPGTVGTLRINGNFTNGANATLQIDLSGPTGDLLEVGGATVLGGILQVRTDTKDKLLPGSFRILRSTGPVSGSFQKQIFPGSLTIFPSLVIGPNAVDLVLTQLPFSAVNGLSPNARVLAGMLDERLADPRAADLVGTLNAATGLASLSRAINQLSPLTYRVWFPSAVLATTDLVGQLDARAASPLALGDGRFGAYLLRSLSDTHYARTLDAETANSRLNRTVGGVDCALAHGLTLGAFYSNESTAIDNDNLGGKTRVDGTTWGLRADLARDAWRVRATAFTGADKYRADRSIMLTGLGQYAHGETSGDRLGAALEASRTFAFKKFELSPYLDTQLLAWTADAFAETGTAFSSSVGAQSATSFLATAGLRWSQTLKKWGMTVRPYADAGWRFELGETTRHLRANFDNYAYRVTSESGSGGYIVKFGLGFAISSRFSANLGASYEKGLYDADTATLNAGLAYRF